MRHLKFLCTCVILLLTSVAVFAQTQITGHVADMKGEAIIGANVTLKGTTNGTITDFDGHFTLNVNDPNGILAVSFIGYKTKEVKIGEKTIFQIILEAAYEKYVSAANQNNQNYQEIARLGYVSKAYLVLAAIGTSGGALNLLAQMLINQANQYEADQRIPFFRRHPDIGTFVQQHAEPYGWPLNDNYALAYRVLQIVCGIQRGSQPYSHMKKAELVLKGYVSESSSTQLTSLNIAINGGLAMGHYWKGRLLLEQAKQDHDRCNDYKDAAIASFCATNVTERFDHLPENADEDAAPQLSPPQWLSAIELLRYPDREVFRVDRRMVFQTIYQKLTQQVEEVQSDRIQIHNERYRLTKKDVRSNMERCLDMVKVQFPDKEPLIQEMIRSIR